MITSQTFTTGAYIQPKKIGEKWIWIVVGFEDDTFNDMGKCIDPIVESDTMDGLVEEEEE